MGSHPSAFSSTIDGTTLSQMDVLQLVSPRDSGSSKASHRVRTELLISSAPPPTLAKKHLPWLDTPYYD